MVGEIMTKTLILIQVFFVHNFLFNCLQCSPYKFLHVKYTENNTVILPRVQMSGVVGIFFIVCVCVVCVKDSQISSLERGLRELEDQVMMLRSSNMLTCEERQEEVKQMEVYRNHTKFMKNKVVQV